MGLKNIKDLNKDRLLFVDKDLKIHEDIDFVFEKILDLKK